MSPAAAAVVTIGDLLLAASHAEWREKWHQQVCQARAAGRTCQACLDYESDWLAADKALAEFVERAA
jgi:hypothetical protein